MYEYGFNIDALKETVLTEAELKLVKNGVDVDIYMTVVGKKTEELGEDKAILEKTMAKDDKAVYLDLKLFKKIGNNDPTAITEVPGGKIKVSVVVVLAAVVVVMRKKLQMCK